MALLSREESLLFIRDFMEIPVTKLPCFSSPSMSASKKVSFLETLFKEYLEREPFQSLSLMSDDVKDRHRPSWDEIKRNIFLLRGGLCYWLNTFMYVLLTTLGCNVSMAHSTVTGFSADNHVLILIHDLLTPGDLHLVDLGIGNYVPRPIPLDFVDESPVYRGSILTYKLKRESESKITMLKTIKQNKNSPISNQSEQEPTANQNLSSSGHSSSSYVKNRKTLICKDKIMSKDIPTINRVKESKDKGSNDKDSSEPSPVQEYEWEEFFHFNPLKIFKNLDEFFPCFDVFFSDVTKLPFHTSPRAMRWSGGRFVGIVDSQLLEEREEGKLTKTQIIKCVGTANPAASKENDGSTNIKEDEKSSKTSQTTIDPLRDRSNEIPSSKTSSENSGPLVEDSSPDVTPLVQAYKQYFPQFPSHLVLAALKNWTSLGNPCLGDF